MSSFIGQDQFEKIKYKKKIENIQTQRIKAQKGWARTGHSAHAGCLT